MTVATEERRIRKLLDNVEAVESVSATFPTGDERRTKLEAAVESMLAEAEPVRVEIAARLLHISDKTVRVWAREGVLKPAVEEPRLLLDATRLHTVIHLAHDLRAAGKNRNLLDAIWYRLSDQAFLDRDDLQESLAQVARGEYAPLDFSQFGQSTKDA
jgi:hypothetical protein